MYELRERLAQASRDVSSRHNDWGIDLFLTFTSPQLVRLPWEAWEIGTEFSPIGNIRIARAPANIHQPLGIPHSSYRQSHTRQSHTKAQQPRILVILGDDTGIDLTADLDSINSLKHTSKAYVKSVGWTGQQSSDELIHEITAAIADPNGWDVLFFAGHSQEMKIGGGK
ncbi:MAG: hypothetical protein F6K35_41540 [Okeania sp. SIO2H7]|nr:hypothetical protein [Okeania sp. SIO2H7]